MARRFNTTGDCRPEWHYMIPPVPRLPDAVRLVENCDYFVVHAPRQTGKTTTLIALAKQLTASGKHAALHFTCETGEVAADDFGAAERMLLYRIRDKATNALPEALHPPAFPDAPDGERLGAALAAWARACPRPLALFFDEIDALRGKSLLAVLRQLRGGFSARPNGFPASVILCGLRDVRDYKAAAGGDPNRIGSSSPFNVKVESMKLSGFDRADVEQLYGRHTADTGQVFTREALDRAFEATAGQPWLVNALAREIIEKMAVPPSEAITAEHIEEAKERLILARATHLDSLAAKLMEPRVRRVIEPILAGMMEIEKTADTTYDDDLLYSRDLGLLAPSDPIRIANPIYKEVIVRVLASPVQSRVFADPRSFVLPDGRIDLGRMLDEFAAFWREHGDVLANGLSYHEAAPQLVLMAFLHRLINGGGTIDREYGIGRGRIDLLIRWPYLDAGGKRAVQREAIELKVWRDKKKDPGNGLVQLDDYLDKTGLDTGVLVIFDRRKRAKNIEKRTRFHRATSPSGKHVTVLRG